MQGTSESLAGRVAILSLLPLSFAEIRRKASPRRSPEAVLDGLFAAWAAPRTRLTLSRCLLRGGFPELWGRPAPDRRLWLASYIQTYLERDVRSVLGVRDLGTFQTFLRLAAARTGQVLNLTDLARDAGVSPPTARQWLNVLEASHQIYLPRPYFESFGMRLVKSPKLYWLDTGVATFLLNLHDEAAVLEGPMAGALFETAMVAELAKLYYHRGLPPALWTWRSRDGWEVDALIERHGRLYPVEIKATSTPRPAHAAAIQRFREMVGNRAGEGLVAARVERPGALAPAVRVVPWDAI